LGLPAIAAAFIDSTEARLIAVRTYYWMLLHRSAAANEALPLAALTGDRFMMEAFILSSQEYWNNG